MHACRSTLEDPTDWADKFLCKQNLDRLLNSIREDKGVWTQYQAWSEKAPCRDKDTTRSLDNPCLADESFVDLVEDPAREFKIRVGEIFHRLWEVETGFQRIKNALPREDRRPRTGEPPKFAPPHDGLVEFAEMTLRSIDWPARQRWDVDPSSIPPRAHGPLKALASLVPYQASIGASGLSQLFGGRGTSYSGIDLGWQPTFHLSDRLMLQAPFSITRWSGLSEPGDSTISTYLRGGFGASVKRGGFKVQSYGVAMRPTLIAMWTAERGFGWWPRPMLGWEASVQGLAGKAKLTGYYTGPGLEKRAGTAGRLGVMLGITDIPGIVYWLVR